MTQSKTTHWATYTLLLSTGLLCLGCAAEGPASGMVSGTVTLDGQPLSNADVQFYPVQGRASYGVTDQSGQYELMFTYDTKGCLPGEHQVKISTQRFESDEPGAARLPELVPRKYRKPGELTATVAPGENEINFDLTK